MIGVSDVEVLVLPPKAREPDKAVFLRAPGRGARHE